MTTIEDFEANPVAANITSNGKQYRIEVRAVGNGYQGFVDYASYGGGKTIRAAISAIKRRLAYLANEQPTKRIDSAELEARMADTELKRRKNIKF